LPTCILREGDTDARAPYKCCGRRAELIPIKLVDTVGVVVMLPVPVMLGISRKLKGRSSEERMIFEKIISIWYCSKILEYFLDIDRKSGVSGVVQPPKNNKLRKPENRSFLGVA